MPPSVLSKLRKLGIAGQRVSLELALNAMVGGYEKALDTLPAGSYKKIVEGAFGKVPEMAKSILREMQ